MTEHPFTQTKLLVTHPGKGHTDDLLATAILLATRPDLTVERREPTAQDLNDPQVLVYDVGGEYSPHRGNFDHHQMPADNTLCAFSLILEALGIRQKGLQYWPWLNTMEVMDTQGPKGVGKLLGINYATQGYPLASPIENIILFMWGHKTRLEPGDDLHYLLLNIGTYLRISIHEIEARIKLLQDRIEFFELGEHKGVFLNLERERIPSRYIDLFWKNHGKEPLVSISEDERGDGHALYSRDPSVLNFNPLKNHQAIKFVTTGGYLAKTHAPISKEEAIAFARTALVLSH